MDRVTNADQHQRSALKGLWWPAQVAKWAAKWFGRGVAFAVVAVIALALVTVSVLLLTGPSDELGDVTFTLKNERDGPVSILAFDLPARLGNDRDPPRPWTLRAGDRSLAVVAGPLDLPAGLYVAVLTWRDGVMLGAVTTEIPVSPLVRRACDVRTTLGRDGVTVEPCFDQGPRPWFRFE